MEPSATKSILKCLKSDSIQSVFIAKIACVDFKSEVQIYHCIEDLDVNDAVSDIQEIAMQSIENGAAACLREVSLSEDTIKVLRVPSLKEQLLLFNQLRGDAPHLDRGAKDYLQRWGKRLKPPTRSNDRHYIAQLMLYNHCEDLSVARSLLADEVSKISTSPLQPEVWEATRKNDLNKYPSTPQQTLHKASTDDPRSEPSSATANGPSAVDPISEALVPEYEDDGPMHFDYNDSRHSSTEEVNSATINEPPGIEIQPNLLTQTVRSNSCSGKGGYVAVSHVYAHHSCLQFVPFMTDY